MKYNNGDSYDGEWKLNKWNGEGTLKMGTDSYEGSFKDGTFHGKGQMKY